MESHAARMEGVRLVILEEATRILAEAGITPLGGINQALPPGAIGVCVPGHDMVAVKVAGPPPRQFTPDQMEAIRVWAKASAEAGAKEGYFLRAGDAPIWSDMRHPAMALERAREILEVDVVGGGGDDRIARYFDTLFADDVRLKPGASTVADQLEALAVWMRAHAK